MRTEAASLVSVPQKNIPSKTLLLRYDAACRAIAEAISVDEAKDIRDHAEAMRAYAHQAKNRELEIDAAEIKLRAERRLGELIALQRAAVGLNQGARLRGRDAFGGAVVEPPKDVPTLAEAGIDKKLSARAQRLAVIPEADFVTTVQAWRAKVSQGTERLTTNIARGGQRGQTKRDRPPRPLPVGEYRLLYADPPWRYEHVVTESRAIENQYPTMSVEEICALTVPAARDAVLFLWATSPKLAEAVRVIDAWGFSYRTCAVWDKEKIGMGYYFRQQHELLLVAARGQAPVPEPANRPASVVRVKRRGHSEKPDAFYELIEAMYPAFGERDRIELFSRRPRHGWTTWSNEPALVVNA